MEATTPPAATALAVRIGREIHAEMIRQALTQEQLAERVDRSQQWVSRRITGRTAVDATDLELIAAALGVPVTQLLPANSPATAGAGAPGNGASVAGGGRPAGEQAPEYRGTTGAADGAR